MKRIVVVMMAAGLMALGACASSKPCPAYAKALDNTEING